MILTKVHLFVLLLLALVFCSFFGGTCNHGLEGFAPSGQYSSYADMYSDTNKNAKKQDALNVNDRKDKDKSSVVSSRTNDHDDTTTTKYAPYKKSGHGIPASHILPGQEDLYILKSEVVPPVCPICPSVKCDKESKDNSKCPPCPPCARCPEPAFECKKVPNYARVNDDTMPYPVLNSFSQFGL